MAISFKEIPKNLRAPGSYHEISNRLAGSSSNLKVVLIFAALSAAQEAAGTTTLYKEQRILSSKDATDNLGDGEGADLCQDFLALNTGVELYALPAPKDYSGVDLAADVLPKIADFDFNWLIFPGADESQIAAINTELEARYQATKQRGARCFVGKKGSATELMTFSAKFNCPHLAILPLHSTCTKPLVWLGRLAATITKRMASDPSASLNQLKVAGITSSEQFGWTDRNNFLFKGLSTWTAARDGSIYLERIVTSYTQTPEGTADSSYLDIQIPETLDAIRNLQNAEIRQRFAGFKLGPDTLSVEPGQKALTPALLKGFLLGLYRATLIGENLWCVNPEAYKESLRVNIAADDKNTIEWYDQPELIGRFDVAKGLSEFK